ncbi:MAG: multidrug efflux SMR transporter [Ignavibacteriales bacterium]|nr:multidrug efflux SMR transporter [Ignavibacteriales bacterium]
MPWIYLLIASIFEIIWAISLKYTKGFTKIVPIIFYAISGLFSAFFLSKSLKNIPLGVAYSIWMGIGIMGAVFYDNIVFQKNVNPLIYFFIFLIIIGIVGLRIITNSNG